MDSLGAFKQYVADPQGHSVGFLGTIMEQATNQSCRSGSS